MRVSRREPPGRQGDMRNGEEKNQAGKEKSKTAMVKRA
jgi:hypothetical protein